MLLVKLVTLTINSKDIAAKMSLLVTVFGHGGESEGFAAAYGLVLFGNQIPILILFYFRFQRLLMQRI